MEFCFPVKNSPLKLSHTRGTENKGIQLFDSNSYFMHSEKQNTRPYKYYFHASEYFRERNGKVATHI